MNTQATPPIATATRKNRAMFGMAIMAPSSGLPFCDATSAASSAAASRCSSP